MWNRELYIRILEQIKKEGSFSGVHIKSKEEIYEQLALILNLTPGTIKDWSRKNSGGPGTAEDIAKLEEALNLPKFSLSDDKTPIERYHVRQGENNMSGLSDFTKDKIMKCYELIMDYLHDDNVQSEERFSEMEADIRMMKIAIPTEIFNQIEAFIDENIAPFMYGDRYELPEFTDEEIEILDDGSKRLKTDAAIKKMMVFLLESVIDMEKRTEAFGMDVLFPYLMS